MRRPICLFVGGAGAPNVVRSVSNLGAMLGDRFDLHLVTTRANGLGDAAFAEYECFGTDRSGGVVGAAAALRRYLRRHDPAVAVQVTKPPVHGSIVGPLAKRYGVPFVYRYAGDRFVAHEVTTGVDSVVSFGLNNVVGRVPFELADHYVAMGPAGRRRLTDVGADESAVHVLPPGIDPDRFRAVENASVTADVAPDATVVAFVGRLTRLKGLGTIESTLPAILDRRPDFHVLFVGDDARRPDLPERCEDSVSIVGEVPPARVPRYLALADLLVHPTLTEGLPRVVLEALCAGTKVVARDVGDVGYATENTFTTEEEFLDMVTAFEDLPLDDVGPFERERLSARYRTFFERFEGGSRRVRSPNAGAAR